MIERERRDSGRDGERERDGGRERVRLSVRGRGEIEGRGVERYKEIKWGILEEREGGGYNEREMEGDTEWEGERIT
jgi:hypothetical protein